jgi:hypothetical protein
MRHRAVSRVRRYVAAAISAVAASGCATGPPEEAYRLPPTTLDVREMETRTFEADENMIIGACVALLQDMEYNIDAVETQLGVLTASKVVDADSAAQKAGLIALDVVSVILAAIGGGSTGGGAYDSADDEIGLDLTLVVLPSLAREGDYTARFTVQTTLYDKAGRVKERNVTQEPLVYQEIFDKLSKALFLETQSR